MKICKECGAYNSDDRQFCVDCFERLGDKVSQKEEMLLKSNIDKNLDKLYHKNDPLHVNLFDKIVGIVSIAGVIALVFFSIIMLITKRENELLIIGIVAFLFAVLTALVPKLFWELDKIRLSFIISNVEDTTPSFFYLICRKSTSLILVVVGIVTIGFSIFGLFKPPVIKYIDEIANNPEAILSSHSGAYINAKPELWKEIIDNGDYTVSIFINKLENSQNTGLRERLMIDAIIEITGIGKNDYINTKEEYLVIYYNSINGFKIE